MKTLNNKMHVSPITTAIAATARTASKGSFRSLVTLTFSVLLAGQAWAATTRWVNDTDPNGGVYAPPGTSCTDPGYATIQAAVTAASPGDTIMVCDGTYPESVTIGSSLTLLGPNAGISWSGARGPEAIVSSAGTTINVTDGTGVTIDGFTINGDFGVYVSGSVTDTAIKNNIITGTSRALSLDAPGAGASVLNNDLLSNIRSLHVSGGAKTDLKINGNRFSGAAGTGIFFQGTFAIDGFEFMDNDVQHLANIAARISDGTVSGNTFHAFPGNGLNIQINLHDSTVTDNAFDGFGVNAGLQLFGSQFGLDPSEHVTISGNTFNNCNGATRYGIQLSPDIHHITITDNDISNGMDGVNTRDITPWDVTGKEIHINYNNITGNTGFGVRNGQMGTLDAECNWWGDASGPGPVGPGTGDKVSPNVDFTPWLTAPAPGGDCFGGIPSTPGKVTGGGQVAGFDPIFSPLGDLLSVPALMPSLANPNSKATFGFSVRCCPATGNLEYNDHDAGVRIKAQSIDGLFISDGSCGPNTHARFTGTASVIRSAGTTTEPFTVEVDDCGEPGAADTFRIETTTYSNGPSILIGGNIQIHKSP